MYLAYDKKAKNLGTKVDHHQHHSSSITICSNFTKDGHRIHPTLNLKPHAVHVTTMSYHACLAYTIIDEPTPLTTNVRLIPINILQDLITMVTLEVPFWELYLGRTDFENRYFSVCQIF